MRKKIFYPTSEQFVGFATLCEAKALAYKQCSCQFSS